MRRKRPVVLAGVVAALAGVTAVAAAERAHVHTTTVSLPDGSVEQIRYVGDIAPRVVVGSAIPAGPSSPFDTVFGADTPFAAFDRITAEMDRQAAAMIRQVAAMGPTVPSAPGVAGTSLDPVAYRAAALAKAPAGTVSYTVVSSTENGVSCSRSVRVTSLGADKAPQVVRNVTGKCDAMASAAPAVPVIPATPAVPAAPAKPSDDSI